MSVSIFEVLPGRLHSLIALCGIWRKEGGTRHEDIFKYVNIAFCGLDLIIFCLWYRENFADHKFGINNEAVINEGVVSGLLLFVLRYVLSWILFFAVKREQRKRCSYWCYVEVLLILILLIFILTGFLIIFPLYYIVIIVSSSFRVYGLWIIYYFSLDTDLDFDPKVYYLKKEPNSSTTDCTMNSSNLPNAYLNPNAHTDINIDDSSRYYLPPEV